MRKKNRQLPEQAAWVILERGEYIVLGLVDPDGHAYTLAMNYAVKGKKIYFHCAFEGKKIESLEYMEKQQISAAATVVGRTEVRPAKFTTGYESTNVKGNLRKARDEEHRIALEAFIDKYSYEFKEEGLAYIQRAGKGTEVFYLEIEEITGKGNLEAL
jgi:nitroimidazol reductase NimA-like FMN-containing flavoprotein (pyridoxamine 5'-phosphate oxidase superfamily)